MSEGDWIFLGITLTFIGFGFWCAMNPGDYDDSRTTGLW